MKFRCANIRIKAQVLAATVLVSSVTPLTDALAQNQVQQETEIRRTREAVPVAGSREYELRIETNEPIRVFRVGSGIERRRGDETAGVSVTGPARVSFSYYRSVDSSSIQPVALIYRIDDVDRSESVRTPTRVGSGVVGRRGFVSPQGDFARLDYTLEIGEGQHQIAFVTSGYVAAVLTIEREGRIHTTPQQNPNPNNNNMQQNRNNGAGRQTVPPPVHNPPVVPNEPTPGIHLETGNLLVLNDNPLFISRVAGHHPLRRGPGFGIVLGLDAGYAQEKFNVPNQSTQLRLPDFAVVGGITLRRNAHLLRLVGGLGLQLPMATSSYQGQNGDQTIPQLQLRFDAQYENRILRARLAASTHPLNPLSVEVLGNLGGVLGLGVRGELLRNPRLGGAGTPPGTIEIGETDFALMGEAQLRFRRLQIGLGLGATVRGNPVFGLNGTLSEW